MPASLATPANWWAQKLCRFLSGLQPEGRPLHNLIRRSGCGIVNYLSDAFEHIHLTLLSLVFTSYLDSTEPSSIFLRLCEPRSFSSSLPAPHPHLPTSTCSLLRRHLIGPHIFVTSTNEDDFLAEANLTVMTPFAMSAYFPRGGIQTADTIHAQRTCKRTRREEESERGLDDAGSK